MAGVVALLWALCWVGAAASSRSVAMDHSDLVETETGWRFDDDADIRTFDAPAPTPAAAAPPVHGDLVPLINGDFELTTSNGTGPVLADSTSTAIVNWTPGQAGVQILQGATYGMPSYSKTKSAFCIHLNNPAATANGTQGSLSTTLATAPANGHAYTVHYDVCRAPDGPLNLWPAIRVSAMNGATVHDWAIHNVVYNMTDTIGHSTWSKQSLVYTGTGAATVIKFESMSEKYGPIIDNVQILVGKHPLAGAPLGKVAGLCQRVLPLATVAALAAPFHIF